MVKITQDNSDPGDITSASGPARGKEPAEPQIVPWADDFLKECEKRLAEFNATADKDSPEYPGVLADIVNKVREEFERQEAAAFEVAYEGKFSKLEVRPGLHGQREVQFTLRGGLDNLEAACKEINEAMKGASNYPERGFKVFLSGKENDDLPRGEDITIAYTPVIKDSGNRVRFGSDPAQSHEALLRSLSLEFVNNDLHRLACGALRVKEGFPKDLDHIGIKTDKGDLNEGMVVRTEKGSRSGAVRSYSYGVSDGDWGDDRAGGRLVVAGASPRN